MQIALLTTFVFVAIVFVSCWFVYLISAQQMKMTTLENENILTRFFLYVKCHNEERLPVFCMHIPGETAIVCIKMYGIIPTPLSFPSRDPSSN